MSEDNETDVTPRTAAAPKRKPRPTPDSTAEPAIKEPTQDGLDPAASAEPAAATAKPYATVSGAAVDPIVYSRAVPTPKNGPRKSLTVYHVQRRLYELGHTDGWSDVRYGELTRRSVAAWQEGRGDDATGVLTRAQFEDLFVGDPNVALLVDTVEDHPVV